jgi:hypothetical protein
MVLVMILLGGTTGYVLLQAPVGSGESWLSGWQYRKSHVISSATGAGTNYQVKIVVWRSTGTDSGENVYVGTKCRTDFGDVRFTASGGATLLDYWMESSDSSKATFWVEVAGDLSTAQTIYVYYGNSGATTTSNGDNTFLFFDDFFGSSLDTNKWTKDSGVTASVSNSEVTVTQDGWAGITGKTNVGPYNIRCKIRGKFDSGYVMEGMGTGTSSGALSKNSAHFYNSASTAYSWSADSVAAQQTAMAFTFTYCLNEILWISGHCYWKQNGILLKDETVRVPNQAMAAVLAEYAGSGTMDWVFLSKYVSSEPAHSTWGSEETLNSPPYAPTPSSPAVGYHFNPSTSVTFSWAFSDPDAGDYQTAYQFQLADTPIFSPPLINTGKVSSTLQQTTQTLPSTVDGYYWRVKTWDSHDAEGPYNICVTEAIIVDKVKVAVMGTPEITSGLVLYSSMNEGAGTSAFDLSPYNNAGTINGATWVDGKYGKALSFDGINDYVDCGTSSTLDFTTQDFSLEAWVYPTKISSYPYLFDKVSWANYGYAVQIYPSGFVEFGTNYAGHYQETRSYAGDIVINNWYHLIIVRAGTAGKIYINGVDRTQVAPILVNLASSAARSLRIGGTIAPLEGTIDEVRIYNRALTQAEILQLYRIGNSRQNVGEQTVLAVKLAYEYDGTPITTGAFTLNGLTLTHQGSGVWAATDAKGSVQSATYNSVGGTESPYSLTAVNMNGASATVIWDRIKLTACGILNNVVDTRTGGKVWYQAVYEYGSTSFSSTGGTLYLGTAMNWTTDRWTYDFPYQMSGSQKVFQITSVADTNYGLTTINHATGDLVLNWATMAITMQKP